MKVSRLLPIQDSQQRVSIDRIFEMVFLEILPSANMADFPRASHIYKLHNPKGMPTFKLFDQ